MRHQRGYRHLGRTAKHRRALFRNLSTQLITHERITTTLAKAKEMRPWIEKIIRLAQHPEQGVANRQVNRILFTNVAINKVMKEIAPRFARKNVFAGFTKIESIGRRTPDSAEMALIEIMGNPIQEWEKAQDKRDAKELGGATFWKWELKLLRQEQQHFKDHLDTLQDKID